MTPVEVPEAARAFPADSRAVELWARLHRDAAYWAARYNGPVYLVGSCLRSGTPRDVDIRIEVADDEFCARYGYKHYDEFYGQPSQRWIDDMAKRCGELARSYRINPDFQVYAASGCIHYRKKPRLLLAAPSNLDHIVASTAWWDGPAESSLAPITDATGYTGEEGG
jgi:hypothetical protein